VKFVDLTRKKAQHWCFNWFIPWWMQQDLIKLRVSRLVLRHKTPNSKNAWKPK